MLMPQIPARLYCRYSRALLVAGPLLVIHPPCTFLQLEHVTARLSSYAVAIERGGQSVKSHKGLEAFFGGGMSDEMTSCRSHTPVKHASM